MEYVKERLTPRQMVVEMFAVAAYHELQWEISRRMVAGYIVQAEAKVEVRRSATMFKCYKNRLQSRHTNALV